MYNESLFSAPLVILIVSCSKRIYIFNGLTYKSAQGILQMYGNGSLGPTFLSIVPSICEKLCYVLFGFHDAFYDVFATNLSIVQQIDFPADPL